MGTPHIGFSTASLAEHTLAETLVTGGALGFEAIEILAFEDERHSIGLLAGFDFSERSEQEADALRTKLPAFRAISTHAPFIQVPLLTANPGIRRETLRQLTNAIRGTARIGGNACTIHVNAQPFRSIRDVWEETLGILRELGETGSRCGVTVAVETGYPATVEEYCGLIEQADHPFVGACIDVGHIFHYYPRNLFGTKQGVETHNRILNQVVARLGEKLAVFHMHDIRASDFRDHRAPGRGVIDYSRLADTLAGTGFEGGLILELEEPDIVEALEESRTLLNQVFGL